MKIRDVLFWIFALVQGVLIYRILSEILLTIPYIISQSPIPGAGSFYSRIFVVMFTLSTIGIEYLIYSKK